MQSHAPHRRAALSLFVSSFVLVGCASTTMSPEGKSQVRSNHVSGLVSTLVSQPLDTVHAAAQRAVSELRFTTERDDLDAFKGVMVARTADKSAVNITLHKKGETITEVVVGAGAFNEGLGQSVMQEILKRVQ